MKASLRAGMAIMRARKAGVPGEPRWGCLGAIALSAAWLLVGVEAAAGDSVTGSLYVSVDRKIANEDKAKALHRGKLNR